MMSIGLRGVIILRPTHLEHQRNVFPHHLNYYVFDVWLSWKLERKYLVYIKLCA